MIPRLLALVALASSASGAQVTLTKPTAVHPESFSQIRGVRELRDGRVLVTDRLEERLVVADFATGKVTSIGRTGRGPREFRLPTTLAPLPGDSTLMSDEGNSRMAVIGPDLAIHRSFTLQVPGLGVPLGTRGQDSQGRFHLQVPGWVINGRERGDSVPVIRFDERNRRVDTIAIVKGTTSGPAYRAKPGIPYVPFAAQDVWVLAPNGSVAVVRAMPYHVEWHAPNGQVTRGPAVPYQPIAVTRADKLAYTKAFLQNSNTSGRGPDGGLGATPAEFQTDERVREMVDNNQYAETMGPTSGAAPLAAPDGTIWVEKSAHLGSPASFDVFDATGRRLRTVTLPAKRRLVHLGRSSLYLVVADDDGVESLERYALPAR